VTPFDDDLTEPQEDRMTDTVTATPETPPPAAIEPPGSWLVLLLPDGEITVSRMPSPTDTLTLTEELIAFHRRVFRNIPPGVAPKGMLAMSRGNSTGTVNFHVYEGASPSRDQLAKLRPLVLSRWSARVHAYG
jgi:hypothetical protein